MARAATSTLIRPSCLPACGRRTTRSRLHGRLPTRSRTTSARRRPRTIPELQRMPSHDRGPPTLHSAPAPAALVHGGLHFGHAVHRRWHGVYCHAEISDPRFDSQTARDRNSGPRAGPPGGAPALRSAVAAGRPARADEARGPAVALRALHPNYRHAVARLGDAVGGRLPGRPVRGRAPSRDPTAERRPAYAAVERALLPCFRVLCPGPFACRGGALPCARPTRRRIRRNGAGCRLTTRARPRSDLLSRRSLENPLCRYRGHTTMNWTEG